MGEKFEFTTADGEKGSNTEFIMTEEEREKNLKRQQKITHQHTIDLAKAMGEPILPGKPQENQGKNVIEFPKPKSDDEEKFKKAA